MLIILALLPFADPFSTCAPGDLAGRRHGAAERSDALAGSIPQVSFALNPVSETGVALHRKFFQPMMLAEPVFRASRANTVLLYVVPQPSLDGGRTFLLLSLRI